MWVFPDFRLLELLGAAYFVPEGTVWYVWYLS